MSTATDEDAGLVRRCLLHPPDQGAWEELWHRFSASIAFRIRRTLRHPAPDVVEDLTSDVFLRLVSRLHHYEPARGSLAAYVSSVAALVCREYARSWAKDAAVTTSLDQIHTDFIDPNPPLECAIHQIVRKVLANIDDNSRSILMELLMGDAPSRTTGDLPLSVVYRIRHNLRKQIIAALLEMGPPEPRSPHVIKDDDEGHDS